jgi:hypothetical protein
MNHFICITSSGGYIGRFAWWNGGSPMSYYTDGWGDVAFFPATIELGAWAGSIPLVRRMVTWH